MRSIIVISCILAIVFQNVNASPFFFSNPFATGRMANDDQENVSIYTTAEPSMDDDQMPSIYLQIIRNIYERVAAPFNFRSSVDDAEKSSKIVSTTKTSVEKMLEIVEDLTEADSNSTEVYEKEEVDPNLIEKNPSFGNRIRNEDSRPERIMLYPGLRAFREDDDPLEKKNLSESEENDISEDSDSSSSSESEEDEEIESNPNTDQPTGRFSDYAAIYLLESIASAITLAWGAFNAIFQSSSTEN